MPGEGGQITDKRNDQELTNFDVFVLGVSVLSLLNILLLIAPLSDLVTDVVLIADGILCLVLLTDFLLRLQHAPNKRAYVIQDKGWLDLLGSLPFPGLRLARIFRTVRVGRTAGHRGLRGIWRMFGTDRAGSALLGTLFLAIVVLQFGSMFILRGGGRQGGHQHQDRVRRPLVVLRDGDHRRLRRSLSRNQPGTSGRHRDAHHRHRAVRRADRFRDQRVSGAEAGQA